MSKILSKHALVRVPTADSNGTLHSGDGSLRYEMAFPAITPPRLIPLCDINNWLPSIDSTSLTSSGAKQEKRVHWSINCLEKAPSFEPNETEPAKMGKHTAFEEASDEIGQMQSSAKEVFNEFADDDPPGTPDVGRLVSPKSEMFDPGARLTEF